MSLKNIQSTLINILYPLQCVVCKDALSLHEDPVPICSICLAGIHTHQPPLCLKCGRSLHDRIARNAFVCKNCRDAHYYFTRAWSVCHYETPMKDLIHRFKYQRRIEYQRIFSVLIAEFFRNFPGIFKDVDYIIPIPLSAAKYREREFNQAQLLAACTGELLQKPMLNTLLYRARNTKPQANLTHAQRTTNLANCFIAKNAATITSKTILLVDDVFTTGTTVSEAARTLLPYAPKSILVFTLAS